MEQWEVQRCAGVCAGTDRKLEPGEEYYAALIDRQTHFERQDYCREYWQQQQPEVFSYWITRIPLPNQKKKMFIDDDMLVNQKWPKFDEELAKEKQVELAVQINGKIKDRIVVSADSTEDEIKTQALASAKVSAAMAGKEPKKVIVLP